jgi:predicted AlkP superfamily pyrophosphatase or phosphodiesterase
MNKKIIQILISVLFLFTSIFAQPPKLTVVIVIDQFAYHYIEKLSPHFKYAFKLLQQKGLNYTKTYHPHGAPATATGHATISTGATASYHGVVLNGWPENGEFIDFGDDDSDSASVFNSNDICKYGFSSRHIMVDNLSDQVELQSSPSKPNKIFAISLKARAAIAMAGKLGKAIWFDPQTKIFTSSKAYFTELPGWLKKYNSKYSVAKIDKIQWKLLYGENDPAYDFSDIHNYKYASNDIRLAGQTLFTEKEKNNGQPVDYDETIFSHTPTANKYLLDLSYECLKRNLPKEKNAKMLLWVSLSSLDMIGHIYGPSSLEVTDMIYHLDKQIYNFMMAAQSMVGTQNVLFALTADHGVSQIPTLLASKNSHLGLSLSDKKLKEEMNELVAKKHGITKIVKCFKTNQFYLNKDILESLSQEEQQAVLNDLKNYLLQQPGIKNAWITDELSKKPYEPEQLEYFFKNQLYPERNGEIICMTQPYCNISKYECGTAHRTPYECDTHVPLFIYQPGSHEKKTINSTVYITQLAGSLAKAMGVSAPSAANKQFLPGMFN